MCLRWCSSSLHGCLGSFGALFWAFTNVIWAAVFTYFALPWCHIPLCLSSFCAWLAKVFKTEQNDLNYQNINKGICMLMYVVLHGTAQIPVRKAQNQAQNELKRSCLAQQGICSMWRQQLKSHCKKTGKSSKQSSKWAQISKHQYVWDTIRSIHLNEAIRKRSKQSSKCV